MRQLIPRLRRAVSLCAEGTLSDGQLLDAYLARRDEMAFELLVRRHGPMVLGVCRRALGPSPDAEDAFQATFLVLACKGRSVVPREAVGNWLYGVACRTARKLRGREARRRTREVPLGDHPGTPAESNSDHAELRALIDQALGRLPEKYRAPVVLCDLEGKSRREAAGQLGCPEGTLSGRLARARQLLARRLKRHGLELPAGGVAAVLAGEVSAGVPPELVAATVRAALAWTGGKSAAAVAGSVAALTEGVIRSMFLVKLKSVAAVLLGAALVAGGAGFFGAGNGRGGGQGEARAEEAPAKGGRKADPKASADLETLQGEWRVVEIRTSRGSRLLGNDEDEMHRMEFKGEELHESYPTGIGRSVRTGRVRLDPSHEPKQIELTGPDGKHWLGIYRFGKDDVTLCLSDTGKRPESFEPKKKGETCAVLRRMEKPKRTAAAELLEQARRRLQVEAELEAVRRMQAEADRVQLTYEREVLRKNIKDLDARLQRLQAQLYTAELDRTATKNALQVERARVLQLEATIRQLPPAPKTAEAPKKDSAAEREFTTLTSAFLKAVRDRKTPALEELLAENFRFNNVSSDVQLDRDGFLRALRTAPGKLKFHPAGSMDNVGLTRPSGTTAVLYFETPPDPRQVEAVGPEPWNVMAVWERLGDDWKLVYCHCRRSEKPLPKTGGGPKKDDPAKKKDAPEKSPHAAALELVFATQAKRIRELDKGDWWLDTKERTWGVKRPFAPGTIDSTHLFVVTYRIDGKPVAAWNVDTRAGKVTETNGPSGE